MSLLIVDAGVLIGASPSPSFYSVSFSTPCWQQNQIMSEENHPISSVPDRIGQDRPKIIMRLGGQKSIPMIEVIHSFN